MEKCKATAPSGGEENKNKKDLQSIKIFVTVHLKLQNTYNSNYISVLYTHPIAMRDSFINSILIVTKNRFK